MRRVNELVQEVVAEGIGELKDPRIGLVTITAVRISPDLREGTVYFSVFGSEKKKKASIDGLASARAVLQARLVRELRTTRTPHLTFEYDPTVEYGVRMTKLIDETLRKLPSLRINLMVTATDLAAVVDALRSNDRFLVLTHENPDGDALGSMLGAALGLRELGKDVVMHLSGDAPLPGEYGFLPLGELRRDLPDDLEERVVLALDCANERRIGPDADVVERAALVIDVDHHHDNNRFGAVNLIVAEASSTAEIVRDLLGELDVALTPEIAEARTSARHRHR